MKKLVKSPFQYNHSASLKTHYGIDHILKIYLKQTKNNNKQTGHLLNTHSKPKRLIFQTARNYYICKFHMTDKNGEKAGRQESLYRYVCGLLKQMLSSRLRD